MGAGQRSAAFLLRRSCSQAILVRGGPPTCPARRREIVSFGLPQRHIVMVHNPAYLNNTGVAEAIVEGDARVLTIAPHVGQYAAEMLAAQGVQASALHSGVA